MPRLRKGDMVSVLTGKDRGKKGKILQMLRHGEAAIVERVNLMKHFERRTRQDQPGGIIERECALSLAKLALVCPRCSKPTRIGMRVADGGAKQRLCKRCQGALGD